MNTYYRDVWIAGVALFAMFFGAGNLIFPPYMGLLSGSAWMWAMLGFFITGIGLPWLGIIASAKAGGSIVHLGNRVSAGFGTVLSVIIILAIGPLLAIPRTGATAYELAIRATMPEFPSIVFYLLFFGTTLWLSMNKSSVVDTIGKWLTPFLMLTLAWIIIQGIITPFGEISPEALKNATGSGFREGYQTMDALASLVFAQIIIVSLVFKGYTNSRDQIKMTFLAGSIAAVGLGLVYGGLMYLGATASTAFDGSVERTDLLIAITQGLMGNSGKVALGLAVSLACLTTAIGLTATVADFFSKLSNERISYKSIAIGTVVFSAVFATVGVTTIVKMAVPLLVMVYPVAIVLVALTLAGVDASYRGVYIGSILGALLVSFPEALIITGLPLQAVGNLLASIPLAEQGFGWILPTVLGGVIGFSIRKYVRKKVE